MSKNEVLFRKVTSKICLTYNLTYRFEIYIEKSFFTNAFRSIAAVALLTYSCNELSVLAQPVLDSYLADCRGKRKILNKLALFLITRNGFLEDGSKMAGYSWTGAKKQPLPTMDGAGQCLITEGKAPPHEYYRRHNRVVSNRH